MFAERQIIEPLLHCIFKTWRLIEWSHLRKLLKNRVIPTRSPFMYFGCWLLSPSSWK